MILVTWNCCRGGYADKVPLLLLHAQCMGPPHPSGRGRNLRRLAAPQRPQTPRRRKRGEIGLAALSRSRRGGRGAGRQRSITFARDGGQLVVEAPAGRLTAVLRDVLVPLQQTIEVAR